MVGIYYFAIFNNISGIYSMKAVSLSILFILFCSISAHSDYFLSWPKKGMLLLRGTVSDSAGNRYDVRIVPGYFPTNSFGGNQWSKGWSLQKQGGIRLAKGLLRVPTSVKHLHDYITPKPWRGIGDGFDDFLEGENFLFTEFKWENVGRTWESTFGHGKEKLRVVVFLSVGIFERNG
jgi:hypothetical protein